MTLSVVIGAGGTGTSTALLLAEGGHDVRLLTRRGSGPAHQRIERVAADASDARRLTELTEGASTMFNCAAPPYFRWTADFPQISQSLLTAAEANKVDYVMLGNLYAYGPVEQPLTEDLPLRPTSAKGRVRAAMWEQAIAAHRAGRVRVTEVRASDFIGTGAVSLFSLTVAPKVMAGKTAVVPADLDAPHTWTGTTDAARTLVAVAEDERSWGHVWHVPSNPAMSVRDMAGRLAELAGAPSASVRSMPGWLLRLAGLGSRMVRELPEMQYQFRRPFVLDSSLASATFGVTPTPLDRILEEHLV